MPTDSNTKTANDASRPRPPIKPLYSAADRRIECHPTKYIREGRFYALQEKGRRIANSWNGSVENHRTGKIGEYAVAKALGIQDSIDLEVYTDGGDGGVDLNYRGATIDVKTACQRTTDPSLTVSARKPLQADYYVLASRIGDANVRLIGYAPRSVVESATVREYNGDPCYYVDSQQLFPFPRIT